MTRRLQPGSFARAAGTISKNLRRRAQFIARAEGTEADALDLNPLTREIAWALCAIGGDNYPSTCYGILSKLRHSLDRNTRIISDRRKRFGCDRSPVYPQRARSQYRTAVAMWVCPLPARNGQQCGSDVDVCSRSTASSGRPKSADARVFTSTMTSVGPSQATRSSSPDPSSACQFRATTM